MDPFIESQHWRDFHSEFIHRMRETLVPSLQPRYIAVIDRYVFFETEDGKYTRSSLPDLTIAETQAVYSAARPEVPSIATPSLIPLPLLEEHGQRRIEIRMRDSREVVAVVEMLSPTNKRPRSAGRNAYMVKREEVLRGPAHLIELDLLRGGQRMPMSNPLPEGDYYALVSRVSRRPMAEVWAFAIRDRLPTIPIPLAEGDPDVPLDLQQVMEQAYDRAGYGNVINYEGPAEPPLSASDEEWIRSLTDALLKK